MTQPPGPTSPASARGTARRAAPASRRATSARNSVPVGPSAAAASRDVCARVAAKTRAALAWLQVSDDTNQ
ncbi:TPA: hypothetical protein ACH3X3_010715 [Trebouxia sp. C0006]